MGEKKAEEEKTSVFRFVEALLQQKMADEEGYDKVMKQYLERPPKVLKKQDVKLPRREDLYACMHFFGNY